MTDSDRDTFRSNLVFNDGSAKTRPPESTMKKSKLGPRMTDFTHSRLVERDKKLGRKTVQDYKAKREKEMRKYNEKYYVQKVDDIGYLRHTLGPDKVKKDPERNEKKDEMWRKILLWEFLGCTFR